MFYFSCRIKNRLVARGGLESLDLCRKFGFKETTRELRRADWPGDVLEVQIDESLARACGKFKFSEQAWLDIPISILAPGDLELLDMQHNNGEVRLNQNMSDKRCLELVYAALLLEQKKDPE